MKRKGKKSKGKAPGKGFFGMTPKKPEPDDVPGRAAKAAPPMMSGMPPSAPRKKLSARAKKRVEGYRL